MIALPLNSPKNVATEAFKILSQRLMNAITPKRNDYHTIDLAINCFCRHSKNYIMGGYLSCNLPAIRGLQRYLKVTLVLGFSNYKI
jgi:hypothetical protein